MASDVQPDDDVAAKWSPWAIAAAVLLALLFGAIVVAGVRGCVSVDPQEAARLEAERKKKEEDEKKKKREFEIADLVVMPGEPKSPAQFVKPGHWATSAQRMRANYRDLIGESRTEIVDGNNVPYTINSTPFVLRTLRPVALSKGQRKNLETTFFVPQVSRAVNFSSQIAERGLGVMLDLPRAPLTRMPSYQYHFVVLAKEPTRYSFVKTLDSVRVPYSGETEFDAREDSLHYRVEQLDVQRTVPLPDNPLTWSSIAYILWDEVDPSLFTPAQEKALVDWIHWGGQLIVNGPDSLDLLKGSFLEPYLPARNAGPRVFDADNRQLAELSNGWMISTEAVRGVPLRPTAPWSGIELEVVPESNAQPIPNTGELLVEGLVGRGRIVVSAFQLSERELINWRSGFESLFNACILRRPSREYREGSFGGPTLLWSDEKYRERRLDAQLTTRLKYFARDLGVTTAYQRVDVQDEFNQFNQFGQPQTIREYRPPNEVGGLGAWNDFSDTAKAARSALRSAAGVEVPGSSFVVVCLAAYLTVLVPLNWLVFHTLRRIEWAWIAAPIIAIAGTWVVVQQAQLDIGFVRAHTEIGLLETQLDHPRALLTRYSALYTSLSTTYDLEFDNVTTLAAPFPRDEADPMLSQMAHTPLDFQRQENVRLTGLPVSSASTNFVHSEQMFPLDGAIRIGTSRAAGRPQIENLSQFRLRSVAVVRRPSESVDDLVGAWIGELRPGQSVPKPGLVKVPNVNAPYDDKRAAEARTLEKERLDLEPMFQLALAAKNLEPGETRLVARVDDIMPGQAITPAASQVRGATLIVAHLEYAQLDPPEPDKNTRRDIKAAEDAELELEFAPDE